MSVHSLPDKNTNEKNKLTLNITPSYVVPLRYYIVAKQQKLTVLQIIFPLMKYL